MSMRLDPLDILLNNDFNLNKKFYFISGNETSLIEKLVSTIVKKYQAKENLLLTNINSITDFVESAGLFENKKMLLIKNSKGVDENILNKLQNNDDIFIFSQENSQKIKTVKNIFLKRNDSLLIDCYELDKNSKIRILNKFLKVSDINIEENLYWYLVEKLDNKYVFLENNLSKVLELDQKDINANNIKKILTIDYSGKEKIFFNLLKNNKEIVALYREKITTKSDVSELYYYCKFFCYLLIDSKNETEYNNRIPVYLFREKSFLIDIFRRFNSKKKKLLLGLLSSVEMSLRKESDLSLVVGLRFLMNIKKITIS